MLAELEELRKLPFADKLRIVEQLWEDIHDSDVALILQEQCRIESRRRADELEANPDIAITRSELWKRIDQTNG